MSFQAYIDNIKAKTGKTPGDFKTLAEKKGLLAPGVKAGAVMDWLKDDFDLGRGHAMAIYSTFNPEKYAKQNPDEAIEKHFSGNKSAWRKVFDGLLNEMNTFGDAVQIAPTNTYLSILRNGSKFAVVQITANRMDIGIKLKGAEPTARFEPSGSWNEMVTHRVRINNAAEVDSELITWLHNAYNQSTKKK